MRHKLRDRDTHSEIPTMKTIVIQSKLKTRRRTLLITGASLSLLVMTISSVSAQKVLKKASGILNQASGITSTLEPMLGSSTNESKTTISEAGSYVWQAQQYYNQLADFYYNLISGNLSGILGDLQEITGALGIPDPFAIRTQGEWSEQIPGTMATAQAKTNTTDRVIATGIASIVLGKDGQTAIREQQQQVAAVVQQSATSARQSGVAAQSAQSRNVTQDILKDVAFQQAFMAQQLTALAQIDQNTSGQLTGLQLQGAATNLMLSDISGTLDSQQMQRQQEQQARNLSEAQATAQVFIPGIKFGE